MSEYLSAAASALGLPEPLVERSAEARAAETGASVDDILQAWAGGEQVAAAPGPAEEPAAVEDAPAEEETPAQPEEADQPLEPAAATVVAPDEAPPARAPTRAPVPEQVTPGEAVRLPEVITVPTAGIKERTNFAIPKWLMAVLVIAPLFALYALGGSATGQCGEATELRIDVVTGDIVNCDGSEFTGQAVDGGGTDFVALGAAIYSGEAVAGVNCAGCHGANGQGAGSFPALTGVLNTFGACDGHIEWVLLGSAGYQAEGRSSYGDTGKPINGGMPGFSTNLTTEQLAAVVAFERVRFGGGEAGGVLANCGLVEEAAEEGGETPPGEGDGEGEMGEGEAESGTEASAGATG